MTHDELLEEINWWYHQFPNDELKPVNALRAVVELHKPTGWDKDTNYADEECIHCDNGSYPCSTIQAIEKELA